MGTMSYCCMENVSRDMDTCLGEMDKCETIEDLRIQSEISNAHALYNKCQLFIEEYERLTQK